MSIARGADLPTFDDFRRIDRTRRMTGHLQSADLLDVSQVSSDLILSTVRKSPNDSRLAFAGAELLVNWADRRVLYEAALQPSSNNLPVVLRFACAAARQGEFELAMKLARQSQGLDNDNTLPWLLELWILGKQKQPQIFANNPAFLAGSFRDYSIEASQARIRLLEKAGYSPYSARRLGFKPDSDALLIIRELGRPPIEATVRPLLKETASFMQQRRLFLLSELVGQTLERTLLATREDAERSVEVRVRTEEIEKRRDELKQLLGDVERNTIDLASEKQMVAYFDDVLALGEEDAMRRLAQTVNRPISPTTKPETIRAPGLNP